MVVVRLWKTTEPLFCFRHWNFWSRIAPKQWEIFVSSTWLFYFFIFFLLDLFIYFLLLFNNPRLDVFWIENSVGVWRGVGGAITGKRRLRVGRYGQKCQVISFCFGNRIRVPRRLLHSSTCTLEIISVIKWFNARGIVIDPSLITKQSSRSRF